MTINQETFFDTPESDPSLAIPKVLLSDHEALIIAEANLVALKIPAIVIIGSLSGEGLSQAYAAGLVEDKIAASELTRPIAKTIRDLMETTTGHTYRTRFGYDGLPSPQLVHDDKLGAPRIWHNDASHFDIDPPNILVHTVLGGSVRVRLAGFNPDIDPTTGKAMKSGTWDTEQDVDLSAGDSLVFRTSSKKPTQHQFFTTSTPRISIVQGINRDEY